MGGAGAGGPRPHRRRAPCRPDHRHAERRQPGDVGVLHRLHRPDRRRLGRQAGGGRQLGDHLHERRRHPQQPGRATGSQVPAAVRGACAAPRFLRPRDGGAAGSGSRTWSGRAPRSPSTPRSTACTAAPGGWPAAATRWAIRWRCAATAPGARISPTPRCSPPGSGAGEAFALRSGGGGGFGPALERPVEEVAHDVRQGYVTPGAAFRDYGVVCDTATLAVDVEASERNPRRQGDPHPGRRPARRADRPLRQFAR